MNPNIELINSLFRNLLRQPVRNVELGHGSFITMGFGKDLHREIIVRRKKEIAIRPEWFLWVYMSEWELNQEGELLTWNEDDRSEIPQELAKLENKKLLNFQVLDDEYSLELEFEDSLVLTLWANNADEDNKQWMLFTPEEIALTAGPFQQIAYSR